MQQHNIEVSQEIHQNIHNHYTGFYLIFQPIFDINNLKLTGAEALLRYHSSKYADVDIEKIITYIEKTHHMYELGLWIFEQSMIAMKEFQKYKPDFRLNMNISYLQMTNQQIEKDILSILDKYQISYKNIVIEITESGRIENNNHPKRILQSWQNKGIKISMDDFGTGYSSLERLINIKFDEIKLDKCLIQKINKSTLKYMLVLHMIQFAKSIGIKTVCEGIETQEELMIIKKLEPDRIQGYLLARPCTQSQLINTYFKQCNEYVDNKK